MACGVIGETDVIVIGAGHNGLVAAAKIAAAGYRVTVLEASATVGGMTSSGPLIPEAPRHIIHPCAVDLIMINATNIERSLALDRHGLQTFFVDPAYAYLGPNGESLVFWRSVERTVADIRAFSAADAVEYETFLGELDQMLDLALPFIRVNPLRPGFGPVGGAIRAGSKTLRALRASSQLARCSAYSVVDRRFQHPALRSALLNLAAGAGPVDEPGSGLAFILLGLLHRVGVRRVTGGIQHLADSLASAITTRGGVVNCGTPVDHLLVEHGRVAGVALEGGEQLRAAAVLATADPTTVLQKLLPPDTLSRRHAPRINRIPANAHNISPFKVDLALGGGIDLRLHTRSDTDLTSAALLFGSEEQILASTEAARRGEIHQDPVLWIVAPSVADPSQAPPGMASVYLYSLISPATLRRGTWQEVREATADTIVKSASEILGGMQRDLGRSVESPTDMADRTRAHNSCITHVDFARGRLGPLRPAMGLGGYRTPIPGLFLGGSGSHPGGSVSGLPGALSSSVVLRDLARERRS